MMNCIKNMKIIINICALFIMFFVMDVNALAAGVEQSIGLGVKNHTQEEIQAFVESHPAKRSQSVAYRQAPSLSEPYSPGELSAETESAALNLINQMRYIAGVGADIKVDAEKSRYASSGTLINYLNGSLSHSPKRPTVLLDSFYDPLYSCAYTGCSGSNLSGGFPDLNQAIHSMFEEGMNINSVGHRRWLLSPALETVGLGHTVNISAVYVMHDFWNSSPESYVAWPAQVMPVNYFDVNELWSVSFGYELDSYDVSVDLESESDGRVWKFGSVESDGDFYVGSDEAGSFASVVFRPDSLTKISAGDSFNVRITLTKGSEVKYIDYTVEFFWLTGDADVEINEKNFPDETFRQYVKDIYDFDKNGVLSEEESRIIESIDGKYLPDSISSFQGIEYFPELKRLNCSSKQLKKLDVSHNSKLEYLACAGNQLMELNVSKNPLLTFLDCARNQLTELNVSQNTALASLRCEGNHLTELDISKNMILLSLVKEIDAKMDQSGAVIFWKNQDENKELSIDRTVRVIPSIDLPVEVDINEENYPDKAFRDYVTKNLDSDQNGVLSKKEIQEVLSIDCFDYGIRSLKGIEFFTELQWLSCDNNQLTSLDVSQNSALVFLYCRHNQLSSLNIGQNVELCELYCYDNQLKNLDLTGNTKLVDLRCSKNQLINLDVSQNFMLKCLICDENQLSSLNVGNLSALEYLQCERNRLTSLDVSRNNTLQELKCTDNQLSILNLGQDYGALKIVDCSDNQLTGLDVSKNRNLEELNCSDNRLTGLDVRKNTLLNQLFCSGNLLSELYVSDAKSILSYLDCGGNELTSLDVSQNAALEVLICDTNQLTNLELGSKPELLRLECWDNKMQKLDVSNCPYLTLAVEKGSKSADNPWTIEWTMYESGIGELQLWMDRGVYLVGISEKKPGDCDESGEVNRADRIWLARALADWDGYALPDGTVADLNGDGKVNRDDRIYLTRTLAGWLGYGL